MKRIIFKKGKQRFFLSKAIENSSILKLANDLKINRRTMSGWYGEESSMPADIVKKICKRYEVSFPENVEVKDQFWYTVKAGKIGGRKTRKIYGNPGTAIGRRKGGVRAAEINSQLHNNFKKRKIVKKPEKSGILSEVVGIVLGDGSIAKYFISITLNSETDQKYAEWIKKTLKRLFNITAKIFICERNALQIFIRGVNLVEIMQNLGLTIGNKVKQQIGVPDWIISNPEYSKSCLRGLIDTDGCVYFDRHKKGDIFYSNICMDFTNRSKPLLDFVYNTLIGNGFSPRIYGYSIKMRKESDIIKYHKIIGFSNKKHEDKFCSFVRKKYGEVA